jgi:uncharacterized Zn finger protein (UPF0148 family)
VTRLPRIVGIENDHFRNCPACGSLQGAQARLIEYADGTIVCNACHGHMFFSPTEKPMADPQAQTKEQRSGVPPSAKQVRDAKQKANPK